MEKRDLFERDILEGFYAKFHKIKEAIVIFLDEIQNVAYWEKWINRSYEENRYKIFITGSNATLLSSELATSLTGRNIPLTLYPLSFHEYLVHYKKIKIIPTSFYDQQEKIKIEKSLEEYLLIGGMPEFVKTRSIELIQEYFKDIISRDIVNRYRVKYKQELKELAHLLLANLGQIQSLRNIGTGIEIKNINTVKNYLKYLEDSFLFRHLPIFSCSYKKQVYNPDKYYVADVAFFNNIAFRSSDNIGAVYENVVYGELARHPQNEIYYYRTRKGHEVDFVVKEKNEVKQLIQVCYEFLGEHTMNQEICALAEAMDELELNEGIILNRNAEKVEEINGKKIRYISLWKWMLE